MANTAVSGQVPLKWYQIALTDPNIAAWYAQLRADHPGEPESVIDHMVRSIQDYGDGSGSGYDYITAIEKGDRPSMQPDGKYHWGGDVGGVILKGKQHPTRHLTDQGFTSQGMDPQELQPPEMRPLNQQGVDWNRMVPGVQQILDDQAGRVERIREQARNRQMVIDSYQDLVKAYPESYKQIKSLVEEGVHDLDTVIKIVRNPIKKDIPSELGFFDKVAEFKHIKSWVKLLPFVGSAAEITEMEMLAMAVESFENGTATPRQINMLKEFVEYSEADRDWFYKVFDLVTNLPAFAGEIYLTGGIYTAAKKATLEVAKRGLKKVLTDSGKKALYQYGTKKATGKIAQKSLGAIGGATAQAIPAGTTRIPAETMQRMMPTLGLDEDEKLVIQGEGESALDALVNATKGQWIEMVSERSGGLFGSLGRPVKEAIARTTLMKRWMKSNPGGTVSQFSEILNRSGYHGVINEILEERVGAIARATPGIGTGEEFEDYTSKEFWEQLSVEGAAFAVPGIGRATADFQVRRKAKKAEEKAELASQQMEAAASLSPTGTIGVDDQGRRVTSFEERRRTEEEALSEIDAAVEAGDTTEGVGMLARHLISQDPDFDGKTSLEISREVLKLTDDYIRNVLKKEPEKFFEEEGITRDEAEEYYATGSTQVDIQKGYTRTAIKLYKGHDADTLVEEWYHSFWEHTTDQDRAAFQKYHDQSGDTRSVEEHFGQEGRDYFFSEKMHEEAGAIRTIFENARKSLRELIARIRTIRGAKIPKKIQDMYRAAGKRELTPQQQKKVKTDKKDTQFQAKKLEPMEANLRKKSRGKLTESKKLFKRLVKVVPDMWRGLSSSDAQKLTKLGMKVYYPDAVKNMLMQAGMSNKDATKLIAQAKAIPDFNPSEVLDKIDWSTVDWYNQDKGPKIMHQVKKLDKAVKPRSKEFKKWFKGSKVVDDKGEPMVMYHGTKASKVIPPKTDDDIVKSEPVDFDIFEEGDIGFHFGTKEQANSRVRRGGGQFTNARVMPVYLNIKNPLRMEEPHIGGDWGHAQQIITQLEELGFKDIPKEPKVRRGYNYYPSTKGTRKQHLEDIKNYLIDKGYDGIVYANKFESPLRDKEGKITTSYEKGEIDVQDSYIAFKPNQIKGQFNVKPTSGPKIMHQAKKFTDRENFEMQDTAKKIFGVTEDPREAGYILNDGSMLDFSGKNEGGTPGTRAYDHRQINQIGDDSEGQGGDSKWDDVGMMEFIKAGAIRYMPESMTFHLGPLHPDQGQLATMRKLIENPPGMEVLHFKTPITIRISAAKPFEKNYDRDTSWEEIKRDILQFIRTGRKPSIVQQFHQARKKEDIFFSPSERAVEEKFPPTMKSMSVINWIKKQTNNSKEIEWLDISSFLKGKKKITKEDLLEWINANKIIVQDVFKVDEWMKTPEWKAFDAKLKKKYGDSWDHPDFEFDGPQEGSIARDLDIMNEKEMDEYSGIKLKYQEPEHSGYQLPGEKEDYRELLLIYPQKGFKEYLNFEELPEDAQALVGFGDQESIEGLQGLGYEVETDMSGEITNIYKKDREEPFTQGHYEEANVLAHVRFNTRTSRTGEKILFIEELQSDWHTKGRERGYKKEILDKELKWAKLADIGDGTEWVATIPGTRYNYTITYDKENNTFLTRRVDEHGRLRGVIDFEYLEEAKTYVQNAVNSADIKTGSVPDAPFKGTDWIELVAKRMLRYAAENNFDRIAWTTGKQQVERWKSALRQKVDAIQWQKVKDTQQTFEENKEGYYQDLVKINGIKGNKSVFDESIPLSGATKIQGQDVNLEGLIGKQIATQIRESDKRSGTVEGGDLTIGGQGMKLVYDSAFKKALNKLGKKFGTKVDRVEIFADQKIDTVLDPGTGEKKQDIRVFKRFQPSLYIPPKMSESAQKAAPQFQVKKKKDVDFPRVKKSGKYIALPDNINTPQKLGGLVTRLANMAKEGEEGRYWYERSSDVILHAVNGDQEEAQKIAALTGLFSQGTGLLPNWRAALRYYINSKAGEPKTEGRFPNTMVPKAEKIMNGEIPLGIKTNNFYTNLMRHIDPGMEQGVTVDLWIMRALGYKTDAPGPVQYDRASKLITRAAERLGWEPHQVQAAVWTTIKSKWEAVQQKIKAEAVKKGHFIPAKKVDGKKVPGHWKSEIMRIRYRNKFLKAAYKVPSSEVKALDFADLMANELATITMETVPGVEGYLDKVDLDKDYVELNRMHVALQRVITDEAGNDRLAQAVGMMVMGDMSAPGAWLEKVSPGRQLTVVAPKGKTGDITKQSEDQIKEYASLFGLLFHQYGVGYHKPMFENTMIRSNLAEVVFENDVRLTAEESRKFTAAMAEEIESKYGVEYIHDVYLAPASTGYRWINLTKEKAEFIKSKMPEGKKSKYKEITNKDFRELVANVTHKTFPKIKYEIVAFKANSNLILKSQEKETDETYKNTLSRSKRSQIYRGLLSDLHPQVNQVYQDFAGKNDWGKAPQKDQKVTFQVRHKRTLPSENKPKPLASKGTELSLDPERFRDRVQRKIQDKMNRLGHVMKKVREVRDISDEEDAYLASDNYIGRTRERMDKFEREVFDKKGSLLDRILSAGYSIDDFGEYLHARHAKERNDHVAKINEDMPDGGSGMTNEEASEILAKHKGDKQIQKFAQEFYRRVTKRALRERLNAGLIDRETYDKLTTYYKNYVPLFVVKDIENRINTSGKGLSIPQGAELKRVKGSTKERANPVYSAIYEMMGVIKRTEKNKVGLKFLDLAEEFDSESWEVNRMRYKPVYNKNGELEFMEPQFKLDDNVFAVRREGKIYLITIHDEALARGLKNLGTEKTFKYLMTANNYLRSIVTTFNPEFIITNFERDIQTALVHVAGEFKGLAGTVLKNTPKAIRGVWRNVRDKDAVYWSEMYDELKAAGGKVGWFDMDTLEDHQSKVEKRLKEIQGGTGNLKKAARAVGDFVENANEAIESGVRLATYEALRKKGMSKEKAAQVAKGITVNFNKKGEWGTTMNTFYLFFNATIQGNARIAASFAKSKKTRAIMAGMVGMAVTQGLVNYMIAPDEWEKMNKWEKDNYMILMRPDGTLFKLKVPYGYNILHVMGQTAADLIYQGSMQGAGFKNLDYMEAAGRVFGAASDAFSPFGDGSLFQAMSPTVLDPIVQIAENKKFHGGPISPKKWGDTESADFMNYWSKNPPSWVSRAITYGLAMATGGKHYKGVRTDSKGNLVDHYIPGWIDINPNTLDHVFEFMTGGVGKFISRSVDLGINVAVGEKTPAKEIPFIRQFYGEPDKRAITERVLIKTYLSKSKTKIYNHVEVAKFKRYVYDAMKLGKLTETQSKLVLDENGNEVPRVIRDFMNNQRLAQGLTPHKYKRSTKKKRKRRIY